MCSRRFMVCTYSLKNSHLLGINNAKYPSLTLRNLPFAKNQQCKITLSQFDQSAHCWKQCTSHSLTSNLMKYEREKRTSRRIKNANSFSLLTQRRERNKARRRQKQGTLSCDISHDYEIITNQSNKRILTSWVNAPSLVTHHMTMI